MIPRKALGLLAFLPATVQAACAIAVWTPSRIVLAAQAAASFNECTLRRVGGYYVLVSGMTEYERTGFDVWAIIGASVDRSNSVLGAAAAAAVGIQQGYQEVLHSTREKANRRSVAGLESDAPVFAIAGFEGGQPYLARYSYNLVKGAWIWHMQTFPSRDAPAIAFTYLCDPRGIEIYQRKHPEWRADDPVKTVAGMIAAAGADAPAAILVLDRAGAHWKNPGACR